MWLGITSSGRLQVVSLRREADAAQQGQTQRAEECRVLKEQLSAALAYRYNVNPMWAVLLFGLIHQGSGMKRLWLQSNR